MTPSGPLDPVGAAPLKDGFGSVGIFHKEIRDFFGALNTAATPELLASYGLADDPIFTNYSISTRTNAGDAKVSGIEFGYRQSLTFLPDWARGFQLFGNVTRLRVEGQRTADFAGFSPATYSGGVNFVRPRFYIKATYSFQAETRENLLAQSATIPANTFNYRGEIERIGVSAQYDISKRLAIYLSMPDIKNVPAIGRRFAPETPEYAKTERYQDIGYYTTIGIKGRF